VQIEKQKKFMLLKEAFQTGWLFLTAHIPPLKNKITNDYKSGR
jgi:hypothetical protein